MSVNENHPSEKEERMKNILTSCTTFLDTDIKDHAEVMAHSLSKLLHDYSVLPLHSKKELLVALCRGGSLETPTFTIEPMLEGKNQNIKASTQQMLHGVNQSFLRYFWKWLLSPD